MATNRFVLEMFNSAGTRLGTLAYTYKDDALAAAPGKVGTSLGGGTVSTYRIIDSWCMDTVPPKSTNPTYSSTSVDTTGLNQINDLNVNENSGLNCLQQASDTWPI